LVLALVGAAEVLIALWGLSGWRARRAALVQTVLLLSMNVVELTYARPLLLWPAGLIPVNALFLAIAWAAAELRSDHPFYWMRRHPIPVEAFFAHSLVLTYALPREVLEPLLTPGLALETHEGFGFVAVAMVQTRGLRPALIPRAAGQDFILMGYRIFTTLKHDDRTRRGLRILRSDANRALMVIGGNLLTHYHYRLCAAAVRAADGRLGVEIRTPGARADVSVVADLTAPDGHLPAGSPFATAREARRFAGPLPYTFDYEQQTHSVIAIKGVRRNWSPRLVPVEVRRMTFFEQPMFRGARPILASAFYVHDIPYRWNRGVRLPLAKEISS
jgi:hypothetical protein